MSISPLFPTPKLLGVLVKRDLVSKFRRHYFGILWVLIGPLLTSAVMVGAFYGIFGINSESLLDYSVYVLSGVVLIQFVTGGMIGIANSISNSRGLILKIKIPMFTFPLTTLLTNVISFMVGLFYVVSISIWLNGLNFKFMSFLLTSISLFLFIFGIGVIIAVFVSWIPDIATLLPITLQALTYLTPIFYPESIWPSEIKSFLLLNPFVYFVRGFRNSFGQDTPSVVNYSQLIIGSFAVFVIGIIFFKVSWKSILKRA